MIIGEFDNVTRYYKSFSLCLYKQNNIHTKFCNFYVEGGHYVLYLNRSALLMRMDPYNFS